MGRQMMTENFLQSRYSAEELKEKLDTQFSAQTEYPHHCYRGAVMMIGRRDGEKFILIRQNPKPIRNALATVLRGQIVSEGGKCGVRYRLTKTFYAYAFAAIWLMVWLSMGIVFVNVPNPVLYAVGCPAIVASLIIPAMCFVHRKRIREEYLDFIRTLVE